MSAKFQQPPQVTTAGEQRIFSAKREHQCRAAIRQRINTTQKSHSAARQSAQNSETARRMISHAFFATAAQRQKNAARSVAARYVRSPLPHARHSRSHVARAPLRYALASWQRGGCACWQKLA